MATSAAMATDTTVVPSDVRASSRARLRDDAGAKHQRYKLAQLTTGAPNPAASVSPASVPPNDAIPPRAPDAIGGRAFAENLSRLPASRREAYVLDQLKAGNIPDFLRRPEEITLRREGHEAKLKVMPDYLAIGSDDDFVRIPMTPKTAQAVADAYGMRIPTKRIVDEVYAQADHRYSPYGLSRDRESPSAFLEHQRRIEAQGPASGLVAGHKKDIVNSKGAQAKPDRVAIYGWHQANGEPIQPLSTVHHAGYVDYSHGVRLVAAELEVDGRKMSYDEVLRDPELSALLSHEGPLAARLPQG